MSLSIITIDIGSLYQDSGGSFSLSPRSKNREYHICAVIKPIRLLHIEQREDYSDENLRIIIDRLNQQMYMIDGCLLGKNSILIWLYNPLSIVYTSNISITDCKWKESIDPYVISMSQLDTRDNILSRQILEMSI